MLGRAPNLERAHFTEDYRIEVFYNLFEASIDLFRYSATVRWAGY